MLWIVVAVYDNFSKSIMDMNILTTLTNKMFQKLCEQASPVPVYHKALEVEHIGPTMLFPSV